MSLRDLDEHRGGAQQPRDAARHDRVADRLVDAVPLHDLVVELPCGPPADADARHDEVGARRAPRGGRCERVTRMRVARRRARRPSLGEVGGDVQVLGVDVDETDLPRAEVVRADEVGEQAPREDGGAGADEDEDAAVGGHVLLCTGPRSRVSGTDDDAVAQLADALDAADDDVAVLQVARRGAERARAGGRAGEDEVARLERHAVAR